MNQTRMRWVLLILAIVVCASDLKAADAEAPQTFTAKAVIAVLGPKGGLTSANSGKIQAAAQKIITSLLPTAEGKALQHMGLASNDGLSISVNPVPESLLFEVSATAPSSRIAADYANNVAGQLEQAMPEADAAAIQQLEDELGTAPTLLILETAKPSSVTEVKH